MGAIWAPIMYLEIITFPGLFQFYLGDPHILEFIFIVIEFYQYGTYMGLIGQKSRSNFTNMGPIWVLYGQKKPIWGHVGPEWDKCPDSAHMGHIYICLLGCWHFHIY